VVCNYLVKFLLFCSHCFCADGTHRQEGLPCPTRLANPTIATETTVSPGCHCTHGGQPAGRVLTTSTSATVSATLNHGGHGSTSSDSSSSTEGDGSGDVGEDGSDDVDRGLYIGLP